MSRIGEEHVISCVNIKNFYQLPITSADNSFLINDGKNSVVKVHDRKLSHSWTLKHPNSFTCPVAFHNEDQSVFCVTNNNVLVRWHLNDDDLKSAFKLRLGEDVFAIIPVQDRHPLVVFSSGKFQHTDCLDAMHIGKCCVGAGEELLWADAVSSASGLDVVAITHSKKNSAYTLRCCNVAEDVTEYSQTLVHEDAALKSWCLNKDAFAIYTIWSNGAILSHQLSTHTESLLLTVPNVQCKFTLALTSIDRDHIVLLKSNPHLKESHLEMWDIKYSALKYRKKLATHSNQISTLNSSVFLSINEELVEIECRVEKSNLAAAVARSTAIAQTFQEFSWNKQGQLFDVSSGDQSDAEKMDVCMDQKETLNETEFLAQRLLQKGSLCMKSVPESELVKLLKLALIYKCEEDSKKATDADCLLNAIFTASFSDLCLLKFMKKLNLEESVVVLKILLSLLNKPSSYRNNEIPTDLQIFNWICLVIQSHMEALLLSKDKRNVKLLRKLDKCLSEKMSEYEECEKIQQLSRILQKKNILPEKYVVGKYCIETLDI